ncbi:hypothetical protein [Campylobacter mucosalis]|uniref:hypothetical protein n=1 Tax=Campylobacter mucosalis TaxID=202 RepID=UPI00146FCE0A|nr:hypothetical protein [Campylobacter mucosalis]QKF63856.1 hypothetical protein CMCT_1760 [Campylobacter mucosalis]
MKFGSIVSFLMIVIGLSGCYIGAPSYEVFAKNMNLNAKINSPIVHKWKNREIYDENRFIYKINWNKEGCVVGFLTNRDDKPEVVQEWIILSGKEFCKDRQKWACCF